MKFRNQILDIRACLCYAVYMIDFSNYNIKIDSAFSLGWQKSTAYARPRKFDALSFRVKGDADYRHGEQSYRVQSGDIAFVPAHYDYTITANKEEEVFVIHFYIQNSAFDTMQVFSPTNPDVFYRLFQEIGETWRAKPIGYQAKMLSQFYKIAEQIAVQSHKQLLLTTPPKLQQALDFLHEQFTSPETTVETTARHIKTSTVYLRKIFRLALNTTPLKYLNDLRMRYAVGLLKTGYYRVEEIAELSGFNDPKYFSALYKKRTGFLPSEKLSLTRVKQARKSVSRL